MDEGAKAIHNLLQPLLSILTPEQQREAERIIGLEASGVLTWMVKSGYLLWTRTHPGQTPTPELARLWMLKAHD